MIPRCRRFATARTSPGAERFGSATENPIIGAGVPFCLKKKIAADHVLVASANVTGKKWSALRFVWDWTKNRTAEVSSRTLIRDLMYLFDGAGIPCVCSPLFTSEHEFAARVSIPPASPSAGQVSLPASKSGSSGVRRMHIPVIRGIKAPHTRKHTCENVYQFGLGRRCPYSTAQGVFRVTCCCNTSHQSALNVRQLFAPSTWSRGQPACSHSMLHHFTSARFTPALSSPPMSPGRHALRVR